METDTSQASLLQQQVVVIGTFNKIALFRLGMTMVEQALSNAAMAFVRVYTPSYKVEEINQSVAFITGSGLEMAIETFQLGYSAERIRESFFALCKKKRNQISASSSATTVVI